MASAGNTDLADKWVSVVKETTEVHKTTDDDGHKKINTFEVPSRPAGRRCRPARVSSLAADPGGGQNLLILCLA
jgi:hypothetical protein